MSRELIQAAANNQINKVYECLLRGDSINFKENLYGNTALHNALICGHKNVVNLLLYYGANPAIPNNQGFTPCDIYDGSYHRFLDREFEKQQEESSNLKDCLTGDVVSCFEATEGFPEIVTCMGEDNNNFA